MPTFKSPSYSKVVNQITGVVEPCYTFLAEFQNYEKKLTFVADTQEDISLQTLQGLVVENVAMWNQWIDNFLSATKKHFAKPYTIEHINKIAKHKILQQSTLKGDCFPANVTFLLKMIQISGGVFTVNWEYTAESIVIDIPVSDELPDSAEALEADLDALDLQEFDEKNDATELEISDPAKHYDKQRVKELRMRAQLATYKAEHALKDYYDKYAEELSDSEYDSESESDSDSQLEDDAEEL